MFRRLHCCLRSAFWCQLLLFLLVAMLVLYASSYRALSTDPTFRACSSWRALRMLVCTLADSGQA